MSYSAQGSANRHVPVPPPRREELDGGGIIEEQESSAVSDDNNTDDDEEEPDEDDEEDDDAEEEGDDEGTNNSMAEEEEEEEDDGDDATASADPSAMPTAESTDTVGDGTGLEASVLGNGGVVWIKAVPNLDRLHGLREIGREAICWQLSSAKPGNGVEQIRDGSVETYWQSDGNSQPHWIQISFGRRVAISHVCLYLDFALDESYTPRRAHVQVGMTNQDLISAMHPALTQVEFQEPTGWCIIPLSAPPDPLDDVFTVGPSSKLAGGVVRAHLIRISILSMHQNGRDTHVRQVQLFGPRLNHTPSSGSSSFVVPAPSSLTPGRAPSGVPLASSLQSSSLSSLPASQFSAIR